MSEYVESQWSELNGLTTVSIPKPGLIRAGVTFKVGLLNESLQQAGICHFIEHLVLHSMGKTAHDINGFVDFNSTNFLVQGTKDEVVTFFKGIAGGLKAPSIDRIDTERSVLLTEVHGLSNGPVEIHSIMRYGARGLGKLAYEHFGLHTIDLDEIQKWIAKYFVRENAVLWIAGDVPADLVLDLPSGQRNNVQADSPLQLAFPMSMGSPEDVGIGFSVHRERNRLTGVASAVLSERLADQLRTNEGIAYDISDLHFPLSHDVIDSIYLFDVMPKNVERALDSTVSVIDELCKTGITREELERICNRERRAYSDYEDLDARLRTEAIDDLFERPRQSVQEFLDDLSNVSLEETAAATERMLQTAIFHYPERIETYRERFAFHDSDDKPVVKGKSYKLNPTISKERRGRLILSDVGISFVPNDGDATTVMYSNCVALIEYEDTGTVVVVGEDGYGVTVPVLHLDDGAAIVREIKGMVAKDLVVIGSPEYDPEGDVEPKRFIGYATMWIGISILLLAIVWGAPIVLHTTFLPAIVVTIGVIATFIKTYRSE